MTVRNLLQVHSHVYISVPPGLINWGFTELIHWNSLLITSLLITMAEFSHFAVTHLF